MLVQTSRRSLQSFYQARSAFYDLDQTRSEDFISWTSTFKFPVLNNQEADLESRAFTKGRSDGPGPVGTVA